MLDDDARTSGPSRPWQGEPPRPAAAPALYAGTIWRRCLAYIVDVVVIAVLGLALGFALFIIGILSFGLLSPLAILIMALWPLAYHCYFVAARGATPGMRLFDIEFRDWSGNAIEPAQGILVVLLFFVTVALTAWLIVLLVLFTDRSRTLHDILASTVVVRRQG